MLGYCRRQIQIRLNIFVHLSFLFVDRACRGTEDLGWKLDRNIVFFFYEMTGDSDFLNDILQRTGFSNMSTQDDFDLVKPLRLSAPYYQHVIL